MLPCDFEKGRIEQVDRAPKGLWQEPSKFEEKISPIGENDVGYVGWNLPPTNFTRWVVA
jgi:hypothetical protein